MRIKYLLSLASLAFMVNVFAQTNYQMPPKEILELADTKAPAQNLITKSNKYLMQIERPLYKSLDELAEPELRLAGLRINPENFNQARGTYYTGIKLFSLPDAKEIPVTGLPQNLKMQSLIISPQETHLAFIQVLPNDLQLWILDLKTGVAKYSNTHNLNAVLGAPVQWDADGQSIMVKSKGEKGKFPDTRVLPKGPATQDATGTKAPARTNQDLLRNKQDEAKFDYYAMANITRVYLNGTPGKTVLPEAVYKRVSLSPDGKNLMTEEVKQPYSYTLTFGSFTSQFNIYTSDGQKFTTFYDRPLQDKIPSDFDAVAAGKREISWRDDKPATLVWAEAPDGGDPKNPSEFRDQIFQADAPFTQPKSICYLKNRVSDMSFGKGDFAIVQDFWWKTRNTRVYSINPSLEKQEPKLIFDRSSEDVYGDPGAFATTFNAMNRPVLEFSKDGKKLYLEGEGCSPEGNKPFLDEFEIATKKTKRLWRADGKSTYETIVKVLDIEKKLLITSIEAPKTMPNLFIRNFGKKDAPRQITFRPNPYESLAKVSKQKIFYKRKDGVQLSATLYLPAGYDKAKSGKLPMLMEAYPTEYKDDKAAGQVKESPHTFISINWATPVYWVNRGFAILEDAQFPIIGKGTEEPNDTYNEQLVADAEAAIRYVDSLGLVDKNRCAVMGHSYGAFMTANLLCHSNLFAAGIARSGAYNRTLTPFGFQSEERNYWQAQKIYNTMSPFNFADKFSSPILLIHGDADNNPGTFTLQSERLFQAIKGNGGKARLVLLPFESHGYAARENIMHMLWEMDSWLDKWVKNK
jgi:dipeptidyl aminopeptidase/acylaminoacyl peptidase